MYVFAFGMAVFSLLGVIRYLINDKIGSILARDFPDAYAQIRAESWPAKLKSLSQAISSFVWKRRDKGLGHSGITKLTVASLCLMWMIYLAWLISGVGVFDMTHGNRISSLIGHTLGIVLPIQ
jgi:hypothetical protein